MTIAPAGSSVPAQTTANTAVGNAAARCAPPLPYSLQNGVLTVRGGAGNDNISLVRSGDCVNLSYNGQQYRFQSSQICRAEVNGGRGDDCIRVAGVDATIHGGDGADRIEADNGKFQIHGGAGNDTITLGQGGGDSQIHGDGGNDCITTNARCGDVLVHGGAGNDQINANTNRQVWLYGDAGNDRFNACVDASGPYNGAFINGGTGQDEARVRGTGKHWIQMGGDGPGDTVYAPAGSSVNHDGGDCIFWTDVNGNNPRGD